MSWPKSARPWTTRHAQARWEIRIGIYPAVGEGEALGIGALRGTVDAGDQRIRGRLWLKSEQTDRDVDLRRD